MTIGIVGGGIMGLSLAYFLQQEGHRVELFEREEQLGGLATYQDFGPFVWDRFYHCILPSDRELIRFLGEIGLADRLRWNVTKTGFFVAGCPRTDSGLYSVSNAIEFLRFPPLSLVDRLRLGYTILACSRIRDWRALESQPVEEWLGRLSGRRAFERIWKPLLKAKFGEAYQQASAVNIWATIRRMFSARQEGLKKESLGFVAGGYRTILSRLRERLEAGGDDSRPAARLHLGVDVRSARRLAAGWEIVTESGTHGVDRLVFTTPTAVSARVLGRPLSAGPAGGSVDYVGVVCLVLLLRRPLSPYYVLNIADPDVPFTGVIEMSNLITTEETAGRHLVYVPKYAPPGDPIHQAPAEEVLGRFLPGLRKMLGGPAADEIEAFHVFRAPYVQPLQVRHYSERVPPLVAAEEDLYFVNSAQLVSSNLNNNEVIRHARACAEQIGSQLAARGSRTAAAAGRPADGPAYTRLCRELCAARRNDEP
jgi:protoporphyrinogen oxidase